MTKLIRIGDRSDQVADVQSRLRNLGFEIEDDPGSFGETTKRAVMAFQQRRDILVDGIIGPNTWDELVEASWRLGDRALYLRHPMLRGDDVLLLQDRLNALGFDAGKSDGIYGHETATAVRGFQREYGTREDGIFGLESYAALEGLRVNRPGVSAALREQLRHKGAGGLRGALVVVDPGHGGEDLGRTGLGGLHEADACWRLATQLAERLVAAGASVRFTRTEGHGPDSSTRAALANELGADLFLSLHLNYHEEPTAEGASTYHFRSSRAGEALADKIQSELVKLGLKDGRSHARSYAILRETRMPAVLIEPVFITNPDEEKKLEDDGFVWLLADAVTIGVRRHFDEGF
jgi:N-acetylmuramoyl-L-alanine amidase